MVDVATEFARDSALSELLYADDLDLMSETIEGHRDKFLEWKKAIGSKGFIVNVGKTNVMVSSGITKDGTSKSKVDPCGVCNMRVKANSVLCLHCGGKLIHVRCAGVKMLPQKISRNFACRKCEGNMGEAVEQGEDFCDGV